MASASSDTGRREQGKTSPPELSVILIVASSKDTPDAVLAALQGQSAPADVEYIVVDAHVAPAVSAAEVAGFEVSRIEVPDANMLMLKAAGVQAARGHIVAFLEPYGIPGPSWLSAIIEAFGSGGADALGGTVAFGGAGTAANHAAFRFEYSAFSDELISSGQTHDLPGNNMAFRRDRLLELCGDILARDGLNKPFCQTRFEDAGLNIELNPNMAIELRKQHTWHTLLRTRFSYARCFGCTRMAYASPSRRWLYRLGAPAAPLLVMRKHMFKFGRGGFGASLLLLALCLTWGAGEIAGYWFGCGSACTKLR